VILFRAVQILLKSAAITLACAGLTITALVAYQEHESRPSTSITGKFTPGMTVEQMVAVFPTDFLVARIGGLMRTAPCRTASGEISAPDESPVLFPDMKDNDKEGKKLAWDAAQLPLRLDRFEHLDTYLRARKDWSLLIQAWTAYIQESGQSDAVAYCRRGSAYMAAGDFTHGYADTRKSCHLGATACCAELKKLPPEKVTAFEADENRVSESAPACEPPVSALSMFGPVTEGKFKLRRYAPNAVSQPQLQEFSRSEFRDLLNREYKDREWGIVFTYLTGPPRHLSCHLVFGRDGKIKEVSPIRSWD
jgi:hypothetical protein